MYDFYCNENKNQPRAKSVEVFVYVRRLSASSILVPVAYYKDYIKMKNDYHTTVSSEQNCLTCLQSPT